MGTAAIQPSWKDLQAEFLQYAAEHAGLSAVWIWMYPERTHLAALAKAISMGEGVEPADVLKRMYEQPDISGRPPAPKVQWRLEGGSPAAQDLFRVIAGRAAGRLPNPSSAEPWRLWLDSLRAEGYAPEIPARRVFAQGVTTYGASGEIFGSYPEGFEDRHIEHVFKASADFCFVRSCAEAATPNPAASGTPETPANDPYRGVPPSSGPQGVGQRSAGRPKLPAEALQNIIDAEKAATGELEKALAYYGPSNPKFVYHPVEINAGCWKVIEHLTTFAEAIFNAQAREYVKHYPALVLGGDLLTAEVGPEVVRRTKLRWTKWETEIDWALRTRWTPEYYRAYVEEGNQPGSEDQKLVQHFLDRLSNTVSDTTTFWKQQPRAPAKSPDESRAPVTRSGAEPPAAPDVAPPATESGEGPTQSENQLVTGERLFRKTGDFWTLGFGGRERVNVKNSKGMQYIAYLLQCPDQSRTCIELVAAARGERHLPVLGSGGDVLDQTAVASYTRRKEDLEDQLADAERNCDQGGKEAVYEEMLKLDEQLESAFGLGGRHRRLSDDAEKLRKGVSNAIKRAIEATRKHDPALADHFERYIECGLSVRYCSDGVDWKL
jgi:hypothetical protein